MLELEQAIDHLETVQEKTGFMISSLTKWTIVFIAGLVVIGIFAGNFDFGGAIASLMMVAVTGYGMLAFSNYVYRRLYRAKGLVKAIKVGDRYSTAEVFLKPALGLGRGFIEAFGDFAPLYNQNFEFEYQGKVKKAQQAMFASEEVVLDEEGQAYVIVDPKIFNARLVTKIL